MYLTDADLQQLNAERVFKLTSVEKDDVLLRMLEDLKEARERLNGHSGNSIVAWATALSLPDITALDEGTMVSKPKGRCDILPWEDRA